MIEYQKVHGLKVGTSQARNNQIKLGANMYLQLQICLIRYKQVQAVKVSMNKQARYEYVQSDKIMCNQVNSGQIRYKQVKVGTIRYTQAQVVTSRYKQVLLSTVRLIQAQVGKNCYDWVQVNSSTIALFTVIPSSINTTTTTTTTTNKNNNNSTVATTNAAAPSDKRDIMVQKFLQKQRWQLYS